MKKYFKLLSLWLLCVGTFVSCLEDDDDAYVSYGVIKNVNSPQDYQILTDKGNTLIVTRSNTSQTIENGKRVLACFELVSDKDKGKGVYEVNVQGFYNLLSKPLVNESFIRANEGERRDSIGNDPFINVFAWFGGEYININFEAYFAEFSSVQHLINLVYDDTRSSSDTIYLTLKQNAYGEVRTYNDMRLVKGLGRCSFKLSDLLPEGADSKPIRLSWSEYGYYDEAVDRYDTGVFKRNNYSEYEKTSAQKLENTMPIR